MKFMDVLKQLNEGEKNEDSLKHGTKVEVIKGEYKGKIGIVRVKHTEWGKVVKYDLDLEDGSQAVVNVKDVKDVTDKIFKYKVHPTLVDGQYVVKDKSGGNAYYAKEKSKAQKWANTMNEE